MIEETTFYRVLEKPMRPEDIEGLTEIKDAISAWVNYHQARTEFEMGLREHGDMPKHRGDVTALKQKYPRAAAYHEADCWSKSFEPIKVRLGTRACERLLNGEDYHVVLEDMHRGLDAFRLAQQ